MTIYFDRGKITSARCSCSSGTHWCAHIVAAAFERIRKARDGGLRVRLPIADSLSDLTKEQMQKLAHCLLYRQKNVPRLLESAQKLLDGLNPTGCLDAVPGAPDITGGPGGC